MSKPVPLIVIQRAREIISDEQHWCQGTYALSNGDFPISANNPSARRYCAMGALRVAAAEVCSDAMAANSLARDIAMTVSPAASLTFVNDYSGHAAVLSLFDEAIRRLQA
jgi:hypothetical protein